MPDSLICRAMRQADVPACAAIESCVEDGWSADALSEELQQENSRLFAAERDGRIAALCVFQLVCGEANLYAVSTAPEMRRRGAAKALLLSAFDALRREGAETVFLEVRAKNVPARRLYDTIGFSEIGLRRNFYQNPPDDAVLMQKSLEELP